VVHAVAADGSTKTFDVTVRVDTPREADYYRSGGILPYVLRQIAGAATR
jgi:aconitate hydratase